MKHTLKTLTLFIVLLLGSVSVSYAGWTRVDTSYTGDVLYVDLEGIKKHDEYVYYWQLFDLLKPTEQGTFSTKLYTAVNCITFHYANLSYHFFDEPMGMGNNSVYNRKEKKFHYPPTGSPIERAMKIVCKRMYNF